MYMCYICMCVLKYNRAYILRSQMDFTVLAYLLKTVSFAEPGASLVSSITGDPPVFDLYSVGEVWD